MEKQQQQQQQSRAHRVRAINQNEKECERARKRGKMKKKYRNNTRFVRYHRRRRLFSRSIHHNIKRIAAQNRSPSRPCLFCAAEKSSLPWGGGWEVHLFIHSRSKHRRRSRPFLLLCRLRRTVDRRDTIIIMYTFDIFIRQPAKAIVVVVVCPSLSVKKDLFPTTHG